VGIVRPSVVRSDPSTVGVGATDPPTVPIDSTVAALQPNSGRPPVQRTIGSAEGSSIVVPFIALFRTHMDKTVSAASRLTGYQTAVIVGAIAIITGLKPKFICIQITTNNTITTNCLLTVVEAVVMIGTIAIVAEFEPVVILR
jgi:hypothetical protein